MEQWKNSSNIASNKRKERSHGEQDEEGGRGETRRRKGGKRRKKDKKTKAQYEEEEADMEDEPEEVDEDASMNDHEDATEKAQDHLLAAGLEDSDAEDDMGEPSSTINRKRRAWSESDDDDEPLEKLPESSPSGYKGNSAESDEEMRGNKVRRNAVDEEEDDE
ncbi:putative protein CTR9 [Cocos nucifera]|nr:putative protein CTR9 [Cocos nucifera]